MHETRWSNQATQHQATRQLRRLDRQTQRLITAAVDALATDPRPGGVQKLRGQHEGHYRLRVGLHYRVVYTIDDAVRVVEVVRVGSREDIY